MPNTTPRLPAGTSLNRRNPLKYAIGFIMAASAAALLAFGPRPLYPTAAGRVHLVYWEKWTGLEADQMKLIIDDFNNTVGKEKNLWVDYVSMSQIERKTLISTAAGAPPDIAGLWDRQVFQFSSMGALMPLDDLARQYGLTRDKYKPVFYDGCCYKGVLYALPDTVFSTVLLYNKQIFLDRADELRKAGLDPDRPPRTIAELDAYSKAIEKWETRGDKKHLVLAGLIPVESGSETFVAVSSYWFGGYIVDATGTRLLLDSPAMVQTYNWMRSYTERIGLENLLEFRSLFSGNAQEGGSQVNSIQNPFLAGQLAMEQHGPWISAFIEKLTPAMNRWHVPPDQLQRETDFDSIQPGMSRQDVEKLLGPGSAAPGGLTTPPPAPPGAVLVRWPAGIKEIYLTFINDRVTDRTAPLLPSKDRQKFTQWGAAPFPAATPELANTTYTGMDVLVIPRGCPHPKEAFEFIAFVESQKQLERLASMHCNLSPLARESDEYVRNHPNPYVDVFDALAASPNAHPLPRVPDWEEIFDNIRVIKDRTYLLDGTTQQILSDVQPRAQKQLNAALDLPDNYNIPQGQNLAGPKP